LGNPLSFFFNINHLLITKKKKKKNLLKEKGYKLSTLGGYIKGSNSKNVNLNDPGRKKKKKLKEKKKHLAEKTNHLIKE
jgi:hypothetical protein